MDWLSQNWTLVLIFSGMGFFMFRGRLGGLTGGTVHHGSVAENSSGADGTSANAPEAAVDPVGGEAVLTAQALTSVHQGQLYYFASKESRERFEAAPQEFAHKVAGNPVAAAERPAPRPTRHGGCC